MGGITPSEISGSLDIPCDVSPGKYSLEIISQDGKIGRLSDALIIDTQGISYSSVLSDRNIDRDIQSDNSGSSSDTGEKDQVINDICEGWDNNSGYYLKERTTPAISLTRIENLCCWCNGYPYNKNYRPVFLYYLTPNFFKGRIYCGSVHLNKGGI